VCDHGSSQNLIDHLQPLLQQYGAHYLSGHDHCLEALQHQGVYYLVSGIGDTCCYEASNLDSVPADSVMWYLSKETKVKGTSGGFASITATPASMTATFYDQDGNVLFSTPEIAPRVVKKT
jgi:acid phosphatase/tartrate-resistant acid phosphatase type 5